jgi:hypothetical protein
LHNSDEKLHNSDQLDLTWQETIDLLPEDEVEGGSEIYYFTDEEGNIHSLEFLAEERIQDENEVEGSPKRKPRGKLQKTEARSGRHNQPRPARRSPAASNPART